MWKNIFHPSSFSPDIDELARNGMKFTQFYSAYPICSPSRGGLLTGEVEFPHKEVESSVGCTGAAIVCAS